MKTGTMAAAKGSEGRGTICSGQWKVGKSLLKNGAMVHWVWLAIEENMLVLGFVSWFRHKLHTLLTSSLHPFEY